MDVVDWGELAPQQQPQQQRHDLAGITPPCASLSACEAPTSRGPFFAQNQRRVDTPCPAALQTDRRGGAQPTFVLLPDGGFSTNRRYIELGAGTTVVGRCKNWGIRDHHVSRRHVEVTVPEEGEEGSREGCCRIKYIGRNCRVVLVGGVLLKAEQEVTAPPGTRVILNFNNKGLPRYSYTLVSADDVAAMSTAMTVGRRAAAGTASRWLEGGGPGRAGAGLSSGGRGGRGGGGREGSVKRVGGPRFRKEAQDKLQKERDEIFSKFADLKFG